MAQAATKIELPGQPIRKYLAEYGEQSVELFGEPEPGGYTPSHLRWWHIASRPLSSPLEPGDPCFAVPSDGHVFRTGGPFGGDKVTHVQSLSDLDTLSLAPSIVCSICGLHIWLKIDFIGEENE